MAQQPNVDTGNSDFLLCFSRGFLWRVILILALFALLVYLHEIVVLVFAGVLLAIILSGLATEAEKKLPVKSRWSYRFVLLCILGIIVLLCWLLGPHVVSQLRDIVRAIPGALANLRTQLSQYGWGRDVSNVLQNSMQGHQVTSHLTAYATKIVNGVTDIVVIIVIALFLGADPAFYRKGALVLIPARNRERTRELMDYAALTARSWMLGQLVPMSVLGVGTFIGLYLLGVPLAFTLALITACMLFIPYVGSVLAYIPTALIAFTQGPMQVIWVTAMYLGVHLLEGYVITPIVQRHAVRLPPALTLVSQLVMWTVAGILGVIVATPLAAILMVVVQKLYLHEAKPSIAKQADA